MAYPPAISQAKVNQLRVRHLRLAQALIEAGSLHKAAHLLHVSQPTASTMLKEMEVALGGQLFVRTAKGVTPSIRGQVALTRLQAALGELDRVSGDLNSREPLPTMRIGCMWHAFFGPLQDYLADFLAATSCRVEITDSAYPDLMQRLQKGELDCVLARMPATMSEAANRDDYFYLPLYELDSCVIAGPRHPLVRKRKVDLNDLRSYEWVLAKSASILKSAFAAAGYDPPRVRIYTSSFVLSLPFLRISELLTTAPRDFCIQQERLGLARVLPINLPQLLPPVAFIAQQGSMRKMHVALFLDAVRKAVGDKRQQSGR
jgi:DNA-binding transcriptional LysR family regulator